MAILEALAHETPVLISPRCHFPDVEKYSAGRISLPESEPLAESLAALLSCPDELVRMGANGLALVSERYTWDSVAASMVDAYEEGISRHRHWRTRS